ncbi:MAG: hypothetical protein ABIE36_02030 [Candidatus Diapherotrites archaeon]
MANNAYVDALRNSKTSDTKMILSPKRQIVENQKGKCYVCEKTLGNAMCYFSVVEGPDMNTGINSKELRAICPSCYFSLGKNPVKQEKKSMDSEKEKTKAKEKKAEEEELNLFKELKLKRNSKDEMYDRWN